MQTPASIANNIKAVIVEDNPIALKIMTAEVTKSGFQVTAFTNAEQALDYYNREKPRLIILDWNLPGMDGVALCQKIRQSEHGQHVSILMLTGRSDHQDLETAVTAGVDSFLVKPIHAKALAEWLGNAHRKLHDLIELEVRTAEVERYKEEMESMNEQLEESITRANKMAMEAEQAYIELNQIFRTVAGGILLLDKDNKILRYNDSFLQFSVCKEGETPEKCYEAFHSSLCNTPDCPLHRIKNGEDRVEVEVEKLLEDGTVSYYHITATPFHAPGGDLFGIVEHIMDVTERVKAEKALQESERRYKELSVVDELTGLFNKRHFNQALQHEMERANRYGHPLSLIMMDIDNFKHHNDTYGHAEGDIVLGRLGEVVTESVRVNDVACRYGGEEFAVILPNTTGEDAIVVAERIRTSFASLDFFPHPDEKVNKTLSIGISQFQKNEKKINLIERTDENLYEAKKQGKNRYVIK